MKQNPKQANHQNKLKSHILKNLKHDVKMALNSKANINSSFLDLGILSENKRILHKENFQDKLKVFNATYTSNLGTYKRLSEENSSFMSCYLRQMNSNRGKQSRKEAFNDLIGAYKSQGYSIDEDSINKQNLFAASTLIMGESEIVRSKKFHMLEQPVLEKEIKYLAKTNDFIADQLLKAENLRMSNHQSRPKTKTKFTSTDVINTKNNNKAKLRYIKTNSLSGRIGPGVRRMNSGLSTSKDFLQKTYGQMRKINRELEAENKELKLYISSMTQDGEFPVCCHVGNKQSYFPETNTLFNNFKRGKNLKPSMTCTHVSQSTNQNTNTDFMTEGSFFKAKESVTEKFKHKKGEASVRILSEKSEDPMQMQETDTPKIKKLGSSTLEKSANVFNMNKTLTSIFPFGDQTVKKNKMSSVYSLKHYQAPTNEAKSLNEDCLNKIHEETRTPNTEVRKSRIRFTRDSSKLSRLNLDNELSPKPLSIPSKRKQKEEISKFHLLPLDGEKPILNFIQEDNEDRFPDSTRLSRFRTKNVSNMSFRASQQKKIDSIYSATGYISLKANKKDSLLKSSKRIKRIPQKRRSLSSRTNRLTSNDSPLNTESSADQCSELNLIYSKFNRKEFDSSFYDSIERYFKKYRSRDYGGLFDKKADKIKDILDHIREFQNKTKNFEVEKTYRNFVERFGLLDLDTKVIKQVR